MSIANSGTTEPTDYKSTLNPPPTSDKDPAEEETYIKHRVFLNNIDSYHGRYISSYLTDQVFGATKVPMGGGGEGGDEMGEEEEAKTEKTQNLEIGGEKYQIVGTLMEKFHKPTEDIYKVIDEADQENYMAEILKCGFVVFDITDLGNERELDKALNVLRAMEAEVEKVKEIGPKTFAANEEVRTFILISPTMTWGMTKPIDPDEPDTPFTEADYRKRKCHPNYKDFIHCEREVIMRGKKYKDKLKTYVICSGITYGMEQEGLGFLFKLAWNNEKYLPIFKGGNNYVPLIHVKDLAKIVHGVCESTPNRPHFILGVEQTPCKLKTLIKALSKAMGSGRTKEVSEEEAFLYNGITQRNYEMCTVNLNMEPAYITEDLELDWTNELNLVENIKNIIAEFRTYRNLKPIRVLLHGPPAAGKTLIAKRLAEIYGCHYISVKSMIEEKIQNLKELIELEKQRIADKEQKDKDKAEKSAVQFDEDDEEAGEGEEEEESYGDIEDMEDQLREIENAINFSETRKIPDEAVVRLIRELLQSNCCQNQGYILDGYPKNMAQVKELFGQAGEAAGGDEEGGEGEGGGGGAGSKILPEFVISLDATDEFLCSRIMEKTEAEIQGTHYEEEPMLRRLAEFRENNTDDNTILNFFDEIEIHPHIIDVMKYPPNEIDQIIDQIVAVLGPPVIFEPTSDEEREANKLLDERRRLEEEEGRLSAEIAEKRAADTYFEKMEEWTRLLEELQMEEEKLLVAQSEPLRSYLMKFVFPTLTRGLIETARVKPDDPVDFLAEYLFRENPEGRMFDPAYTREGVLIERKDEPALHEAESILKPSVHQGFHSRSVSLSQNSELQMAASPAENPMVEPPTDYYQDFV